MEDVVRNLGLLTLGSRLKRLGERLQADTQEIMLRFEVPIAAGQFPYLSALDELGPISIGELSESLGVAQPGVTRTVGQLLQLGLVDVASSDGDQRRKIVSLSTEGERLVAMGRRDIWPKVEAAVADLCGYNAASLLTLLGTLEDGLMQKSLVRRADLAGARS